VAAQPTPVLHRAHDYQHLIRRWKAVAKASGTRLVKWGSDSDLPLYSLRTKALDATPGFYMSAGIHGDEAASTEGLIAWAEREAGSLRELPLLIFPCLNPWGLQNNCRYSKEGVDLNRAFQLTDHPFVAGWRKAIGKDRFSVALTLHEDYDAQGLYIYEVQRSKPHWGEDLLEVARSIIPLEQRTRVDGRKQKAGLIRRRFQTSLFEKMGYPEAIWLHLYHSERTFTIETPSEFALPQRVAAQVAMIEECVRRARGG
jgi:hypothetical protein